MTDRLTLRLGRDTFNQARAAYLADFDDDTTGDPADTFIGWIERILRRHVARTSAGRAALAEVLPGNLADPVTRTWSITEGTDAGIEAAISDDRRAGRVVSRNAFSIEAIEAAIAAARTRRDGVLPIPPARLPNRLR